MFIIFLAKTYASRWLGIIQCKEIERSGEQTLVVEWLGGVAS
jgi:hypothetical protein